MRKLQLAAKLTPFFVALSANSAVQEGKYSGKASTRVYAWMHTDPARTVGRRRASLNSDSIAPDLPVSLCVAML
jgi:gamma-glutamylcysteine synthetase